MKDWDHWQSLQGLFSHFQQQIQIWGSSEEWHPHCFGWCIAYVVRWTNNSGSGSIDQQQQRHFTWTTWTLTDRHTDGETNGLPVKDLQALLHAGEQPCDEGLQAGEESSLQGQVVPLVQHQQDRLHRHGGVAQQREQPRATTTETRALFTPAIGITSSLLLFFFKKKKYLSPKR